MATENLEALPAFQDHLDVQSKDKRLMTPSMLFARPKHNTRFILPEVFTTYGPPLSSNELHGHYSQAMVGGTVPGFPDPSLQSVGLSMASDLKPEHLKRSMGGTQLPVPQIPQLGDKSHDPKILQAMQSLLTTGQQTPQMVDARELDAFRRGWRGVGRISPNF